VGWVAELGSLDRRVYSVLFHKADCCRAYDPYRSVFGRPLDIYLDALWFFVVPSVGAR